MDCFAILLAGTIEANERLKARLRGVRVIAADAGIAHAETLGLEPELWVGDFDSAPSPAERFPHAERRTFPAGKDKTDGELAIEAAIERGARRIVLVGALGGPRTDHAFAHFVLLLRYAGQGLAIGMDDGRERAFPLSPRTVRTVDTVPGTQFSVLKFSDVEGLTIEGAVYPLSGVDIPFTSILTQSNEAAGPIAVRISAGRAILLVQDDPRRH